MTAILDDFIFESGQLLRTVTDMEGGSRGALRGLPFSHSINSLG
jgi:hypothetical protein